MNTITKAITREIIEDFTREIDKRKTKCHVPDRYAINFRREMMEGKERTVWNVPTELLRYRKDNGRISSDVMNYEKRNGLLDEKSKTAQDIIKEFLESKDKEKTEELYQIFKYEGQRDPAIMTCNLEAIKIIVQKIQMSICTMELA